MILVIFWENILNNILFKLYQKIAFLGDAEKVHDISLPILEFIYKSYFGKVFHRKIISKKTKQFDISFDNPVGLAAGFDKNADYLNFISNIDFLDEKTCGKFERYQTKIASMVGAIEGGIIYMENYNCKVEVYRYSSQGAASLNMKSSLIENLQCFTKGYFVFCRIIPALMTGF